MISRHLFNLSLWAALTLVAVSPLVAAGCASRQSLHPLNSFVAEDYPAATVNALASRTASTLAEIYPPGHTSIFLNPSANPKDELYAALEQALRAKGFKMASEKSGQALTAAYVLDRLDDESWYMRLTVSDGLSMARAYRLTEGSLEMGAATITGQTEPVDEQS